MQFAFLAVATEAMFFLFAVVSMHRGNPYRLYDAARLLAAIEANLPTERSASPIGWGNELARPHPPLSMPLCGSAWGGSFTFSDDVADKDAWPHLLSLHLGCQIENFGSDGYGLDQTALMIEHKTPANSLLIVGLNWPMLQLDALTSWTFIDLTDDHAPRARVTKPIFERRGSGLTLIPRPTSTVEAITAYYARDAAAADWTPLTFPYSLAAIKAIWRHFNVPEFTNNGPLSNTPISRDLHARGSALIARMADLAYTHNDRLATVLLPPADIRIPASQMYRQMLAALPSGTCVIDPSDEINTLAAREPIGTASGHFTAGANAAIARAVAQGLARCGFTS
ncbi:hypothetical protein [Bradyrhizobium sp. UFLA05-112]